MPRYIQQVRSASGRKVSEDVYDLTDDQAACRLARDTVREQMSASSPQDGEYTPHGEITVTDDADRVVICAASS